MIDLIPHLVLRTQVDQPSPIAMILRRGGYAVTKAADDDYVLSIASGGHAEGVVIDLPAVEAIALARRLEAQAPSVPVLAISNACGVLSRAVESLMVLKSKEAADEIITTADRMIVDREIRNTRLTIARRN